MINIKFIEKGNKEGKIIVFIHACGVSSWTWYEQFEYFKDYHCIYIDLPEHGLSIDDGPFDVKTSADSVAKLIRKISKDEKVYIIGNELGGKVALELLKNNDELVEKAIVSSLMIKEQFEAKLHKILPYKFMLGVFKLKLKVIQYDWYKKIALKAYGVKGEENEKNYLKSLDMYSAEKLLRVIREGCVEAFSIEELKNTETKVLVLAGENEIKQNIDSCKQVSEILQNSKLLLINNTNQNHLREKPIIFNNLCRNWIEDKEIILDGVVNL